MRFIGQQYHVLTLDAHKNHYVNSDIETVRLHRDIIDLRHSPGNISILLWGERRIQDPDSMKGTQSSCVYGDSVCTTFTLP